MITSIIGLSWLSAIDIKHKYIKAYQLLLYSICIIANYFFKQNYNIKNIIFNIIFVLIVAIALKRFIGRADIIILLLNGLVMDYRVNIFVVVFSLIVAIIIGYREYKVKGESVLPFLPFILASNIIVFIFEIIMKGGI